MTPDHKTKITPTEDAGCRSPCVGRCAVTPDQTCSGCGRTLEEIGGWQEFSESRKRDIVSRLGKPAFRVPNADLRSGSGRLAIKPIADLFGMDVIEIVRLIGLDHKAAIGKVPDTDSLQELLRPFSDIASLRAPDFGDDQFRKWLNAPNGHMLNCAPVALIREGRVQDVAGFVHGISTGQPA